MKLSKRFLVFVLIISITLFLKLNNWNDRYAAVETFRGAALNEDVLYPLMSKNLNDGGKLKVYINGEIYSDQNQNAILDDGLNPVGSLDFIRTVMGGSAFMLDDSSAMVQITNDIYEFLAGNRNATANGDDLELSIKPSVHVGQLYVGLEDLCKVFGYEYTYDKSTYTANINIKKQPRLPKTYDLRSAGRVSFIRNQGSTATCWACASLEALESSLLPANQFKFSVDSMIKDNSFSLDEEAGGEYTMALAYLLSWQGPVEVEETTNIIDELTGDTDKTKVHLQEVHFYDSENLDGIKRAVYQYGGVSTSIYASVSTADLNGSSSYNRRTNSYCYTGNAKPNHDVVIIGWDDNYPAENFSTEVSGSGAFICQNSWGSGFGDNGVFYISYYDSNIGNQAVSYVKADLNNTYNYIYQSDLCGWVGQIGYSKEWAYGANTFTADSEQQIEAAGFYALGKDTNYQIYFVSNYINTSTLSSKEMVASGTVEQAGYYTVKFNAPKTVTEGENFAIVIYINTPNTLRPLAVEYASDKMTKAVDITDGKGFISNNGLDWENVEDVAKANLCIKAYANNVVEVFN
ncbi:lectin like domain-containing protein [Pseudobutyrivibrio xylanivorans]|uniref:Cell surface protein n=1 Tax=Pseudobutyrivibrio xylanivorans TaxID=185007 RepID=A0A5P6VTN5_PSEXY|nr:lectin like domain-containing protein [Pseudobutyrivibrio xylanivorans]QFJ56075.1 cell surface protein [Pseudobutyrivibrio xylanivorans]